MSTTLTTLKIHPKDNVLVALKDIARGTAIDHQGTTLYAQCDIKAKHKLSLEDLKIGEQVIMYGVVVGKASQAISKGDQITTENIIHQTEDYSISKQQNPIEWESLDTSKYEHKTFMGYHREDGKVGTENNWLVIPLVFCQNRNVEAIKKTMLNGLGYSKDFEQIFDMNPLIERYKSGGTENELLEVSIVKTQGQREKNALFPNVDGVYFLTHDGGCGGSTSDSITLCNLLAGYINNPNVAGATILSLGCQHAQSSLLEKALNEIAPDLKKPVYFLEQQESKSEPEYMAQAIKKTFVGLVQANKITRSAAPLSKLTIGLECGGSDGFSGISANPTLGYVSDLIISLGGSAVLSEFPELNGVEQELLNRCTSLDKAKKFAHIMQRYNEKATALGAGFYANPSPGNIKDGLITDAIKSAGAAKKGGTSPVVDVLDYTEQVVTSGLNLLCTPGNDVESTTGISRLRSQSYPFYNRAWHSNRKSSCPGNQGVFQHSFV